MVEHVIRRHYASIVHQNQGTQEYLDWQIHYRQAGKGAPVVLLHPSPFSSQFMTPLIQLFATHSLAIAWDTPGYGQSDALPTAAPGLDPYVEALHNFIDALGLSKPVIYGSATGAQIAIEYARKYPKHVRGLLLENVAWFFDEERSKRSKRSSREFSCMKNKKVIKISSSKHVRQELVKTHSYLHT